MKGHQWELRSRVVKIRDESSAAFWFLNIKDEGLVFFLVFLVCLLSVCMLSVREKDEGYVLFLVCIFRRM
jgi:hypothetical protein